VSVFVDSSVWYAAMDSSDTHNARAKVIVAEREPLVTTDHVLIETWRLIRHRAHRELADKFWDSLRNGLSTIELVTGADLEAAWQIGLTYPDQDTSFAVMRRLGIERAASFNHHFAIFRFGPDRRRAFTILH
jgi:uncharacterized protein